MRELIDKLNYYTDLYNQGRPAITDADWDKLYFKLQELEKQTGITYADSPTQSIRPEVIPELKEEALPYKMLSLAKTKEIEEINNFISSKPYVCSLKLDGLSCELVYRNGILQQGFTRGNGLSGSDISTNVKVIANIPQAIPYKDELIVCGEVLCKYSNFEAFSADYANPRNFASGSLKLLDANECKKRKLSFFAWEVIGQFKTYSDKLDFLAAQGFDIVPAKRLSDAFTEEQIQEMKERASESSLPIDGLVIKYDNCGDGIGETAHHFKNALAMKFYDEEHETTLQNVEWSMGGRNGQIVPIAVFEPIDTGDSIIEKATLHNISIMKDTFDGTPFKGQKIKIIKSNEIIPQVVDAQNENGEWINELKTKISPMEK